MIGPLPILSVQYASTKALTPALKLEQSRHKQLLHLMYLHSKNEANLRKPVCVTRAVNKLVFKTATKCTGKYLGSPFYKGTLLRNVLSSEQQRTDTVVQFVNGIKRLYVGYQELW